MFGTKMEPLPPGIVIIHQWLVFLCTAPNPYLAQSFITPKE